MHLPDEHTWAKPSKSECMSYQDQCILKAKITQFGLDTQLNTHHPLPGDYEDNGIMALLGEPGDELHLCEVPMWRLSRVVAKWMDSRALIACGSPLDDVSLPDGGAVPIRQGNNAFGFPGLGAGAVCVGATKFTDNMVMEGGYTVAE